MTIKRYVADIDTTITNAYKPGNLTRATASNMGAADVAEIFSIFGSLPSSSAGDASLEKSRALFRFPVMSEMVVDRSASVIPDSGSVSFFLKLYNADHTLTLPRSASYEVAAITRDWQEGGGVDTSAYRNTGYCNWIAASSASAGETAWSTAGGDYIYDEATGVSSSFTASLEVGNEDVEVNITTLVEQWMSSSNNSDTDFDMGFKDNYGVMVRLSGAFENGDNRRSYYTKKLFTRRSQYFFKRPVIEARWDSSIADDSGKFFLSSSLAPGADNLMTLYLYNFIDGALTNIPAIHTDNANHILVSLVSGTEDNSGPADRSLTGSAVLGLAAGGDVSTARHLNATGGLTGDTGIYSASLAYTSSNVTTVFPLWATGTFGQASYTELYTGSAISINTRANLSHYNTPSYRFSMTNLKSSYSRVEDAKLRVFTQDRNRQINFYTVINNDPKGEILENMFYKVSRVRDNLEVIPYGTGSVEFTKTSYDSSGSYFDLDMSLFEAGYMYQIGLLYKQAGIYKEAKETFKFRVEE
jgi:hypothetical protein